MDKAHYKALWQQEEDIAHIHGWDFSHLRGRYEEENDLPWDYEKIVRQHQLKPHKEVLYVRGIVTCFGHNTSLLYYTASLLPLTLP